MAEEDEEKTEGETEKEGLAVVVGNEGRKLVLVAVAVA